MCGHAFLQATQLTGTSVISKCIRYTMKFATRASSRWVPQAQRAKHAFAKEHVCTVCNESFATNDILARHMKIYDLKPVKHQCEFCGKIFASKSSLVFHVKSHTDEQYRILSFMWEIRLWGILSGPFASSWRREPAREKHLRCLRLFTEKTLIEHKRTKSKYYLPRNHTHATFAESLICIVRLIIHKRCHTVWETVSV